MSKPITPEEMKAYVDATWEKCQAEEWAEPVAIGWYIQGYGAVLGAVRPHLRYEEWRPFYALRKPPAQRKPLTDEELRAIENKINPNMRWRSSDEEGITLYPIEYYELVRAIEAAHGIKENRDD